MAGNVCLVFSLLRALIYEKGEECLLRQLSQISRKCMRCVIFMLPEYHKDAIAVCDAFVVTMIGKQESVLVQLREGARETIQINRKKLRSIIETIALCGRQNISLHGHQDSSSDIEGEQAAGNNHGNFLGSS